MREFDGGATRDSEDGKLDFEGFLSPIALERYAQYMHEHRKQADGAMRASDNWQSGMPFDVYMKSLLRHVIALWKMHRDWPVVDERDGHEVTAEEALCAILFNTFGYLQQELALRRESGVWLDGSPPPADDLAFTADAGCPCPACQHDCSARHHDD